MMIYRLIIDSSSKGTNKRGQKRKKSYFFFISSSGSAFNKYTAEPTLLCTFVEALPWTMKRNPCVFRGRLISVTRRDDGSLRPNFKPLRLNDGFTVDGYALEVANEIREALSGLVEK